MLHVFQLFSYLFVGFLILSYLLTVMKLVHWDDSDAIGLQADLLAKEANILLQKAKMLSETANNSTSLRGTSVTRKEKLPSMDEIVMAMKVLYKYIAYV